MRTFTKVAVLMLALTMLLACFASCGGPGDDTTTPKVNNNDGKDEYGRDYIEDGVPQDLRFDGETVTFFTRSDDTYWKIEMDTEATTNDTVNDAIFYRNDTVEKRLGIEIKQVQQAGTYGQHTQWLNTLRNSVLTKSGDYDAAAVYASQGSALAVEGIYYNVKDLNYIDLSKPWWNQTLASELEMFDTLYFLGGNITLSQVAWAGMMVYNKTLLKEYFSDLNIYELVDNHEWTIDKLYELSSQVWVDANNSGVIDAGDTIGYAEYTGNGWLDIWLAALGVDITTKDSEGYPYISIYSERTIDAFEKLQKLSYANPGALGQEVERGDTTFKNGNVLFAASALRNCEEYRSLTQPYGALPMPMYDQEQDGYHSYPQNSCSLIVVLSTCTETDLIGATLELMAAESYRQVTPQYYEVCLQGKYSQAPDDSRMYDIIVNGIKLDFGYVYATLSIGNINNLFRDLTGDFAQTYEKNKLVYETALETLIDKLDELSFMS